MEQLIVLANERVVYGVMQEQCQWCKILECGLSILKGNGKAEDMIVYYALWIGSTKISSVVGII